MNVRLLKSHMVAQGLTGVDMAEACEISYSSWINKTQGRSGFTVDEAIKIKKKLSLSNRQFSDIFFAADGD